MNVNPYKSSQAESHDVAPPRSLISWKRIGLIVGAVMLLIVLLLPFRRNIRPAVRRVECGENMREISTALINYETVHGRLPPAYTVDENGNRLHSWRTLILPFLENQALYDSIDLTKPWDHPDNAAAYETRVAAYECPSADADVCLTTYLAVVGPNCAFTGAEPSELTSESERRCQIVLVDAPAEDAVHWMSPFDTSPEQILAYEDATLDMNHHASSILVGYANAHVGLYSFESEGQELRTMLLSESDLDSQE